VVIKVDQVELPFALGDLPEDARFYWGRYAAKVEVGLPGLCGPP